MTIKEDLYQMFRQTSVDYSNSVVPRNASTDDEIEKENATKIDSMSSKAQSSGIIKSIVASEGVPLEGRSNDELLALLNQNNKN